MSNNKEYTSNMNYLKKSPAINQGQKYKKYKNKISNNLEENAMNLSGKEGFEGLNKSGLTSQTENVINSNDYSKHEATIEKLRQEYDNTLKEYEDLAKKMSGNFTGFINRVNPNNPYLNKVASFSTGETCYITNQGVVKLIPSKKIWDSLNISKTIQVQLNIPWEKKYSVPGTQIPTNPPLIMGTNIEEGQSLGNEGSNVFVNEFLPLDAKPSYLGCYSGTSNNDNMTFIGGSPAPLSGPQIQNGTFAQPVLKNNTFQYITSSSQVPGWYFGGACLINNSSAWGYKTPYPGGNQCVSIQNNAYIYTTLNLTAGVNYTIKFSGCSRNCCNKTNIGNTIDLQLYTTANAFISKIASFTPSKVNTWETFSFTFTVPTTQTYNLYFSGKNNSGDQSTAVSNVSLSTTSTSNGRYSFSDCEQAAILQGYQYFGLQNVDANSGLGYCAVSNSEPSATKSGESMIPNKAVALWSSNTAGQSGNTAILSVTGSLEVLNSSGQSIYSSPSSNATPSNYLGCYKDSSSRTMELYNKGKQQYSLEQCQDIAEQNGYSLFGLQNSTSGKNAQCALSKDMAKSTSLGRATNCTKLSDGSWSGGGWSNAVYNTTLPQSNYYLVLQDDGNMVIYRGKGPDDNQGSIWSTQTNGKQQTANPSVVASKGKYGKNWISSGSTLSPGDFIGSSDGKLALVMESDGNLVLYTYQMGTNCTTMADGNIGGGLGANAIYNVGMKAFSENLGKIGYIDSDSNLYSYPNNNIAYSREYSVFKKSNTLDNNLQNGIISNANVDSCQTACNKNTSCAGFVFDNENSVCYLKNSNTYPYGSGTITSSQNSDLYIKNRMPKSPPIGVSKNTNVTDSITFNNYKKGGDIGKNYGLATANTAEKQQLDQLEKKLSSLSNQMSSLTQKFGMGTAMTSYQGNMNYSGISDYLRDIKSTNREIKNVATTTAGGLQNILNDSDIVVLQKNYDYLFWSILAAATVLVSMNIVKKE